MKELKEEFYPMPSFVTLMVADLERSTAWYQQVLGFRCVFSMKDDNGTLLMSHMRWRKYADIMLTPSGPQEKDAPPKGIGAMLNFGMEDGTVDDLAARAKEAGADMAGPIDKPWNARELTVLDPDGFLLTFTQPTNKDLTFDEVISNVQKEIKKDDIESL